MINLKKLLPEDHIETRIKSSLGKKQFNWRVSRY